MSRAERGELNTYVTTDPSEAKDGTSREDRGLWARQSKLVKSSVIGLLIAIVAAMIGWVPYLLDWGQPRTESIKRAVEKDNEQVPKAPPRQLEGLTAETTEKAQDLGTKDTTSVMVDEGSNASVFDDQLFVSVTHINYRSIDGEPFRNLVWGSVGATGYENQDFKWMDVNDVIKFSGSESFEIRAISVGSDYAEFLVTRLQHEQNGAQKSMGQTMPE